MRLGQVIRAYRHHRELSLRDVSDQLDIGAATLMRVEQGQKPSGETLARILRWLMEKAKDDL